MRYDELTFAHKVYKINEHDLVPVEMNIIEMRFLPSYQGSDEKLVLKDSALFLIMRNGIERHAFTIKEDGHINDEESVYFFSLQEAEEECIIMRTNEQRERNLDV